MWRQSTRHVRYEARAIPSAQRPQQPLADTTGGAADPSQARADNTQTLEGGRRLRVLLAHRLLVELADAGLGQLVQEQVALGQLPFREGLRQVVGQLRLGNGAAVVRA